MLDAYPPENMSVLSKINYTYSSINGIYINNDRLIVIGNYHSYYTRPLATLKGRMYTPQSFIHIFDISNRSSPTLVNNITSDGYCLQSRMIDDYLYVLTRKHIYSLDEIYIPEIRANGKSLHRTGFPKIYYFGMPDTSYSFTTIFSVNIRNANNNVKRKIFLTGNTQTIYVSRNNIYTTYPKTYNYKILNRCLVEEVLLPSLPAEVSPRYEQFHQATIISIQTIK